MLGWNKHFTLEKFGIITINSVNTAKTINTLGSRKSGADQDSAGAEL